MRLTAALLAFLAAPTAALAMDPTVIDCDWQASAQFIAEPWEQNTRTFANGEVRVTLIDTVEPAAAWAYLMIVSPPRDELGFRQCKLVSNGGSGFSRLDFAGMDAEYDPARGLTFFILAGTYLNGTDDDPVFDLAVILNQATGEITTQVLD